MTPTVLDILVTQTADQTQQLLTDNTPAYNASSSTGGWGAPNTYISSVISVYLSAVITTPNGGVVDVPSFELMPTGGYPLPYILGQQFILTPTLMGLSGSTFPDGIYNYTYTVNCNNEYDITSDIGWASFFVVGNTITDTTTSQTIGILSSIVGHTIYITPATGNIVSIGDVLTNGTHNVTVSATDFNAVFVSSPLIANFQTLITGAADCCIGNLMAANDPCDCGCSPIEELYNKWMSLMCAKAAAGNFMNNKSLDDLQIVENYCSQSGCQCGCS